MPFEPPPFPAAPAERSRRIVRLALSGDLEASARLAREQEDPEDLYLDLVLAAAAARQAAPQGFAAARWSEAIAHYRPLVEEGLSGLHLRYLGEALPLLGAEGQWALLQALEPEVDALGALTAAHEPPGGFVRTLNDLVFGLYGREQGLQAILAHGASHLLLADMADRLPDAPDIDEALHVLLRRAGDDAGGWVDRNAKGGSPFTREQLKRALLKQMVALTLLHQRGHDITELARTGISWARMEALPRPLRLEMLTTTAALLERTSPSVRAALAPLWRAAALPADWHREGLPRRYAGLMAQLLAHFVAEVPTLADELEATLSWFLDHSQILDADQAEETALNLSEALSRLPGERHPAGLIELLGWCRQEAPGVVPRVLADLSGATGCTPDAHETGWPRTPTAAWRVVREAREGLRPRLAAEALRLAPWSLAQVLSEADLEDRLAAANLLTTHPDALAQAGLGPRIRSLLRQAWPTGQAARTLDLLEDDGPDPIWAILLQAAWTGEDDPVLAHDQALRQILPLVAARDVRLSLRVAGGFSNRNHTSWFVGHMLEGGWLEATTARELDEAAPHPFLVGAMDLEQARSRTDA
ncbi:MAG: hypothetical protein FJY99_05540 [Candidatus Sericytochromatia bacterium]|nr:hypothetical protein [Candidatus Tanganyikabacteria bacterium]